MSPFREREYLTHQSNFSFLFYTYTLLSTYHSSSPRLWTHGRPPKVLSLTLEPDPLTPFRRVQLLKPVKPTHLPQLPRLDFYLCWLVRPPRLLFYTLLVLGGSLTVVVLLLTRKSYFKSYPVFSLDLWSSPVHSRDSWNKDVKSTFNLYNNSRQELVTRPNPSNIWSKMDNLNSAPQT